MEASPTSGWVDSTFFCLKRFLEERKVYIVIHGHTPHFQYDVCVILKAVWILGLRLEHWLYLGAEMLSGRGLAHVSWGQGGRGRFLEGSWGSRTLL